jgi:hypothetical protein
MNPQTKFHVVVPLAHLAQYSPHSVSSPFFGGGSSSVVAWGLDFPGFSCRVVLPSSSVCFFGSVLVCFSFSFSSSLVNPSSPSYSRRGENMKNENNTNNDGWRFPRQMVRRIRVNRYGEVPELEDEQPADVQEMETWAFQNDYEPVLRLPEQLEKNAATGKTKEDSGDSEPGGDDQEPRPGDRSSRGLEPRGISGEVAISPRGPGQVLTTPERSSHMHARGNAAVAIAAGLPGQERADRLRSVLGGRIQ